MRSSLHLCRLTLGACLLGWTNASPFALAQPDTGNHAMVVPAPPSPFTTEELTKITGGPTLVTFAGQNLPVTDVVKGLMSAAGVGSTPVRVVSSKQTPATIAVNWKDKPFWEAAQDVEALTGLRWQILNGALILGPAQMGVPDLSAKPLVQTPFVRIYGESLIHSKVWKTSLLNQMAAAPDASDSLQLTVKVYYDPKIVIRAATLLPKDIQIPAGLTAQPQPVVAAIPVKAIPATNGASQLINTLIIPLPGGIPSGMALTKVTATARALATVSSKKWVVNDLLHAAPAQESNEGTQYAVDEVKGITGGTFEIHLTVDQDAKLADRITPRQPADLPAVAGAIPTPLMAKPRFGIFSRLTVKDAGGKELLFLADHVVGVSGAPGRAVTRNVITYFAGNAVGPFSMEWELPSMPREIDTPFELDGLKVP